MKKMKQRMILWIRGMCFVLRVNVALLPAEGNLTKM